MDDREKYLQEESAQDEFKTADEVLEEEYPFDSNPSAEAVVKWQRILRQIEHELKVADDDKRRAAFQFSLGEIQQTRFGRKDKAIQHYQKAFESDRRHKPTIRAAIALFREAGMWKMVAELIEALTECDLSQSEQVELYIEQAFVFGDHLNQSGRAADFLLKALDLDPTNSNAFTKLERLRINGEDRHALTEFYREFAANPAFRHWNGMLNMRLAQLMEKSQDNWEEAIERYRTVLEIEPDNLVALDALRRLLSKHERWLDLLDLYGEEESTTEEPERLALLKYQRARILSEQLEDNRSAQTLLREGLELDPENGLLLDELEGLYENSHQWAEQAEIRRMLFVLASSLEERVELAFRLGALYDEKLNDIDHAADWYEKSIELNTGYLPALQVLERLYERAGRFERLFEVLVKQAAATDDKKLKATKHFMAAEVAQQHLNDPELVIEQYKKVLDLMPGYLPAVKALSELYTFLGRPRDLIEMNNLLASGVPNISPEQFVYLMEKNGSLYEQLGNIEEGIACFENILERLPEHIETIKTLGRLYARAEMWEKLIAINEQEAALINDQHRIVSLLCKCGEVCERDLKDEVRAIDYFRKVLQLSPAYHPAVKALGEIYVRLARWEDLIRMYHRELDSTDEVERKTAIRYRIAQIYEEDLRNPRKAEVNYRQILEEDPGFMTALHALVRLYNRSGNTEALLEIHLRQFERAIEDQQRIFHLCKIAEIHENERNEQDDAVDTYKRILELDPANRLARQSLEKLYVKLERREELLTLLRRELVEEENDTRRLYLLASVARIFEDLGRMDEAIETYREVLAASPQQRSAYVQLEQLLRLQQRYSELADLYKHWLSVEEEVPRRLTLLRSLADTLELHIDDRETTAKTYASILELQPNDSEALDFFEEAYAEAAEWEQLVEVYDRKLALAKDDQSKVRLATAAAYILELELGRKEEALDRYEAALAINPIHFAAVQGARRLYSVLERWDKLAELLEAELKNSYSSSYYVATAYQYGYLLETKFSKRGAACDLYRKVLELKPRHRDSFIRLRKILEEERNYMSLVEILEKRLEVLEVQAEQVDMNRYIAEIAEHELADIEKAIKHRSMVLELLPENLEEMHSMAKLYQKGAHWMDAIDYYRRVANRLEDNDGLQDIYFNIGEIYRNGIMDSEQAVIAFEKVIEYNPDDLHGLEQLAELYLRLEQWGKSADVLEKLLDYELPKERAVRYHLLLGEIYLDHLNSRVKAVPNFEKALAYNPSSQQSIETLAGIFSREERWDQLVDIYLNNLEVIPEGEVDQRVALYIGLGQIYCNHLNDVEKALDSYRSAQELDPQNARVWEKQSEAMGRSAIYYLDAIEKHRALLEVNPYRVESYRELYRIFSERQERDHAFCAAMVLEFLRAETPEQSEFLKQCRQFTAGEVMGVIIPESDRTNLLMHPDEKGLARDILTALDPIIFKMEEVDLEPYDLPSCRVAGVASSIYHLMESTAYYLGVELFKLYISQKQPNQLAVENTKPPTIVIGGSLAYASEGIKRFLAGYVVGRIGNGHIVYSQRDPSWLQLMVETACHMYVPDFEVQGSTASQVEALEKELSRNLPPSSRAEMEDKARAYAMQNERPDFNKMLLAMQYSDDRMGMVMAGELHSAIESAYHLEFGKPFRSARETEEIVMQFADQPRIGAMFEFCVSEDYFNLRNIVRQNIE